MRAQSSKVGRLWFWGVDARGFPGGLLRLDPAFVYVEPPSSRPLPRVEVLTPAPGRQGVTSSVPVKIHTLKQMLLLSSRSVMSDSLPPHGLQPIRLLCPWDSPGKKIGVVCHALLQGILPVQGSNPGLPHCRQILYHLSHLGSPSILEWVAYPFSRRTS